VLDEQKLMNQLSTQQIAERLSVTPRHARRLRAKGDFRTLIPSPELASTIEQVRRRRREQEFTNRLIALECSFNLFRIAVEDGEYFKDSKTISAVTKALRNGFEFIQAVFDASGIELPEEDNGTAQKQTDRTKNKSTG
jgi:hypothetical protein